MANHELYLLRLGRLGWLDEVGRSDLRLPRTRGVET
jgi:hypothetical protein